VVEIEFEDKVKAARLKLFMSQEEFAKTLGVAFATVSRRELGNCKSNYKAQKAFH
jgi:DNA-binding transcriptional regulator YiaG